LFLTVTFDDKNSLILQVMSCDTINDNTNLLDISDADLVSRADKRKQLQLNHPGLGSMCFEVLGELVSKKVIGWNMRNHVSTGNWNNGTVW
jgi:hypothetical protein